jgi:hypothetical protein
VKKIIPTDKAVTKWTLDPFFEIADIDSDDNVFPREPEQASRFQLFKAQGTKVLNPMQVQKQSKAGAVQGGK